MIDISKASFHQEEASNGISVTPLYKNVPLYPSFTGWNYTMKRSMQEIIPGLFLGPYSSAQKTCQKLLLENGITNIICVRQDIESHFIRPQLNDPVFKYLILDIADSVNENIIKFFPQVRQFIDDALLKSGKVLVHGNTGTSRSATLVLAYIMEKFGLTYWDAFQFVKERRACINPNEGFRAQLSEYEPIYKARQTLQQGESSCDKNRLKRKLDHLCESVDYDLIQPPSSPISLNNNQEDCEPETDFSNVCSLLMNHS